MGSGPGRGARRPVEEALAELDEDQVAEHHRRKHGEERPGQRREAQRGRQRGGRQERSDQHDADGRQSHGQARAAPVEGHPPGADGEDDEGLGRQGLHEPAGAELGRLGVQHREHDHKGGDVEE